MTRTISANLSGGLTLTNTADSPVYIAQGVMITNAAGVGVASAAPFFFHQADGFQNLQMLRYSWTADRKPCSQFTDRGRLLAQQVENSLPGRI